MMLRHALQWLLSLLFIIQMYLAMFVVALVCLPYALVSRKGAIMACHGFSRWVRWSAHHMVGLKSEIRGEVPQGAVLVASKHQSFFDIILLCCVLPQPRFIMKKELIWAPIFGWYALRVGCIPVDRGKRGAAVAKMMANVQAGAAEPGQLVIYPQGTRVAPGVKAPYKIGTAILYSQLQQPCIPAATNVGVFWPRRGILRKPGLAVLEFLPVIAPGLDNATFMERLETEVEAASRKLLAEALAQRKASKSVR
jgi:1-acyl-sn-glycerol-3-phosphate acyltransferase